MPTDPRFENALHRIDAENSRDPNQIIVDGVAQPRELIYAQRLSAWVLQLCPAASETLRLAARSQHLCRWLIPRNSYEMTRAGYLRWRSELKKFHAERSAGILRAVGYPEPQIERIQALNLKTNLGRDAECQTLEDALCLVTLQYQLSDLMRKTPPEKLIEILRKTWKKMSPAAQGYATKLPFSAAESELIQRALGHSDSV